MIIVNNDSVQALPDIQLAWYTPPLAELQHSLGLQQ
jgi:hypothetical protein